MLRQVFLLSALSGLALTALLHAAPASAHPHVWIDADATLHLAPDGRIEAVNLVWTFDDLYSEATILDAPGHTPEDLRPLVSEAAANLEEWRYFLDMRADGQRVPYAPVTTYDAEWRDGRLIYRFLVPLQTPLDPAAAKVALRVYDPTFYIDLAITEGHSVTLKPERPGCTVTRHPAEAEPDLTILAAEYQSPDVEPGSEGIGGAFSDTWTVTCR